MVKNGKNCTSKKFVNTGKSLYNKAKAAVKTENGITSEAEVSEGVMQGETMSGSLFNALIINDMVTLLIMYEFKGVVIEMSK